jgi:hypothetical protein
MPLAIQAHERAVRFRGTRTVEGPMNLGQINVYKWLRRAATGRDMPAYAMQFLPIRPGPATTVADVAELVDVLVTRHEGLRTLFLDNHRQRVVDTGEIPLHVLTVDDATDLAATNRELDDFIQARPYDSTTDLPVSVVLAVNADELVVAGIMRCSHLAADHRGLVILGAEIDAMLTDPAARVVGGPRHQPIDQAAAEQEAPLRQRAASALTYWRNRLRTMPANPYTGPRRPGAAESGAMTMTSPAAARAVSGIGQRTSLDRSTAVLTAVLSVLSQRIGSSSHTFPVLSNNRFLDRRLTDYVGTLAASALVDVAPGWATFDELGQRVRTATTRASLGALYDAYQLHGMAEQIEHERGIAFHCFPPIFNNAAGYVDLTTSDPATGATPPTEFTWRPMPPTPAPVRFDLWQLDHVLVLDAWTGDTARISQQEIRLMLDAVERLLLAAADGDLDRHRISAIVGMAPIERDGGWLLLDSCWVELAEVQRLLDDVLTPGCSLVVGEDEGRPLVAYLAATEEISTPEAAHARCLTRVADYPTAITPRHYVLCDHAPADPGNASAWRERHVLSQGPGRVA